MNMIIKKSLRNTLLIPVFMLLGVGLMAPILQPANAFAQSQYDASGATSNSGGDCGAIDTGVTGGINCAGEGNFSKKGLFEAGGIFTTVVNTFLFIIGAVSVIMIIYGGFKYVTSGGDSSGVTSAKNTILYAVIGLIVAMLAYAIMNFVVSKF